MLPRWCGRCCTFTGSSLDNISIGSLKKQESSRKISTSSLLIIPKPLTVQIQQIAENSSRDRNTRPPYLPPEKSVCRSRSNSSNRTWNNRLVPNWERSTSRLYIVTLLINLYAEYITHNAGWRKHKLELGLQGEISVTSDMQMILPLWQKAKRN